MIRLPASADRMYKSTDQQYQDELAVPQDACDGVCGANCVLRSFESCLI